MYLVPATPVRPGVPVGLATGLSEVLRSATRVSHDLCLQTLGQEQYVSQNTADRGEISMSEGSSTGS